ncbi:beta-ketoacyl synthase N-terminal-like domain-containing protein [Streptomyces sp. NPDC048231]|uniref:type I polyketide synthase n=1 Tax=Streptomyces sp. NPDC048231 TaxID=3365519 RepID=UPI00371C67E3
MTQYSVEGAVAVIGLSGRFPGAPDLDRYWENLRDGVCSLRDFTADELLAAGVPQEEVRRAEYVPTKGWLADADRFDHALFRFSRTDAAVLDPQHRLLLETAWSALLDAGLDPYAPPARTGVFAGGSITEHMFAARSAHQVGDPVGDLQTRILTDREFLAPWISYRLGLDGPSIGVQTACSTSLTAVHLAVQALMLGECDTALAGGVAVDAVEPRGYHCQKGGIYAADGRCRPFDEGASGTVPGNGVGLVVLRRLEDALADGDPVRAVIRASAVTNDGAGKVGFTAPGVQGQTRAITEAWAAAGLEPAQAQYLEAHGTGTELGDQVEIAAAAAAFHAAERGGIALGSVKANIGHLDAAAGIAQLAKTVLMLENRLLVPSPGVTRPHPDLARSPFRLVLQTSEWQVPADGVPLRAGVTSLGIGGTNVHVVLEEAPPPHRATRPRTAHVFTGEAMGALRLPGRTADAADGTGNDGAQDGERQGQEKDVSLEHALSALVIDTLGLSGPEALHQSYILAGGDSLHAVDLLIGMGDRFGIDVPITRFLEDVPLSELLRRIAADAEADPLGDLIDEVERGTPPR